MKVQSKFIKAFGALLVVAMLFAALPAGNAKAQTTPTISHGTFGGAPYALVDPNVVNDFKNESLAIELGGYSSDTEYLTMEATLISFDGHSTYVTDRGGCIYILTVINGLEAGDIVEIDNNSLYNDGSGYYSFWDQSPYWLQIGDYTHTPGDKILDWLIYSEKVSDTEYRLVIGSGEYNLAENTDDLTSFIDDSFKLTRDIKVYRGETLSNPTTSSRGYITSSSEDTSSWSSPISADNLDTGDMTYSGVQNSYVDDDWAGSSNGDIVGGHIFGQDAFATIQQAIDGTTPGGTVNVSAGTYYPSSTILVDKPVSIIGPTTDVAEVRGVGGGVDIVFQITSSDVTLEYLSITLDSAPTTYDALIDIPDNVISNINILDNEIYVADQGTDMSTYWARAIQIGRYVTNAVVSRNEMYNTRSGLVVRYNAAVSITDNIIYNTKGGIMNYTGSVADADNRVMTGNSWGIVHNEWDIVWNSGGGPYVMDMGVYVLGVSQANNDAYVVSQMTTLPDKNDMTGNRSHVFVNATTGTTILDSDNGNMNLPYAKIQDGIDAAVPGGTVYVAAGTYVENVVVNKSVEIAGAGQSVVTVMPALSAANPCTNSSLCGGAASNVFLIDADNVTIHDLTIDGDNPGLISGIVRGEADVDARNGIIKNGTYDVLEVYNTTVKNIFLRGIYSTGGSFNFHDNTVTNIQGDYASIAMFAWGGPGTMQNNVVSYANDAISANHSKGINFLNNTVTFSASGIHTDNSNDGGGVADLIQGNNVDCTGVAGAYGVWTFVPYAAPTVNNNTVTNCSVGLSAWGEGAPVTTNFTNNTVTGDGSAESVGAYITTDLIGWGYTDVSVNFTGNQINGFETGLYFTADEQSWNSYPYEAKTINATFENNKIINNSIDAEAGSSGTLNIDASPNWWGSPCGPSVVIGDVAYAPWYIDETMIPTTSIEPVTGSFTIPTTMSMLERNAVIECAAPDTVFTFETGAHIGGIVVNNDDLIFELNGATLGAGSPAFTILGDGITINGPGVLDGDGIDDAVLVADGVYDFTIDEVEITDWANGVHFDGIVNNTLIVDNYMHGLTGDGVLFDSEPVAETEVSLFIQGNLFDMATIGGFGVNAPADLDVTYNSWGVITGPAPETDLPAEITTFDPWTHADLEVYQAGGGTSYPDQVVQGNTITYTVRGNFANVMGADFVLKYPSNVSVDSKALLDLFDLEILEDSGTELHFYGSMIQTDPGTGVIAPSAQLNGTYDLFTVTFTGDVLGKDLVLDVDETTDFFSMSPAEGPSNYVYGTDCLDVTTLEVIALPTIDIIPVPNQDYVAGLPIEFTVLVNNDDGGAYGPVHLDFDLPADAILEYWDGDSFELVADPNTFDFGTLGVGDDVVDLFHVTFVADGSNVVTVDLVDTTYAVDLATTDETFITAGVELLGTIAMQGRTMRSGVPLTLTDMNGDPVYGPFDVLSTSELAYNVLFAGVDSSIFEITTNQARYLNVTADLDKHIYVHSAYTIPALELKGGNAIWTDNVINIDDASEVGTNYGATVDQDADVNFDGKVNIQDLALVGGNYDLTSADAYADWLAPGFPTEGAIVSGQIQNYSATEFAGDLDGDYALHIEGAFTGAFTGFEVPFAGTVSGDINGTVTGTMNINGVDTLFGTIIVDGTGEELAIVGIFAKSGLGGHFYGQIIADYNPTFVTSITVSGDGGEIVAIGNTLQMLAHVLPVDASDDVVWSVWQNPATAGETSLATIDPNTGLLTTFGSGDVVVIAKALDGSHVSGQVVVTITNP